MYYDATMRNIITNGKEVLYERVHIVIDVNFACASDNVEEDHFSTVA